MELKNHTLKEGRTIHLKREMTLWIGNGKDLKPFRDLPLSEL